MSEEANEVDNESADAVSAVSEPLSDYIDLPHGKDLDEAGARAISVKRPTRLIVVAGPVSCGKTTLLISIYELFLAGEMPGWLFAGTATFHGYELRCHPSRVASGQERSHTERTLTSLENGAHYLHLQLASEESPDVPIDLLFTDLTGEIFENARDSTDDCKELTFAARADHFVLLLDGKKVASELTRHSIVHEAEMILRSMLDSGVLGVHSFVCVVFTKFDHFKVPNTAVDDGEFREKVMGEFRAEFTSRVGRLSFAEVAARPKAGRQLSFGHGLPALLNDWAISSPRTRPMRLTRTPAECKRESDLFSHRHFRDL